MSLLLEADPSEEKVASYLPESFCYGAFTESKCRDFFLRNYPEPVFEHGIQHKDMLRLEINLIQ